MKFAVYYGPGNDLAMQKLSGYEMAILEPSEWASSRLAVLAKAGVKLVGYVNVGESDARTKPHAALGHNEDWASWYMDVRDQDWRDDVLVNCQRTMALGFHGVFLDTIDTVDKFPKTEAAMVTLIQEIRKIPTETQPSHQAVVVQNRGYSIVDRTAPYIDYLLLEDFAHEGASLGVLLKKVRSLGPKLGLLGLDYAARGSLAAGHVGRVAAENNIDYYCAPSINLQRI